MYNLLIVEDEKWEREGLVDFLDWSELGIRIAGAAVNGIQGLALAREIKPDIIITDIKMPIMDGIKFTCEVRHFLPDCRFIIISGYDDFEYARQAIELGVCEYLLKPIQKAQLLEALNSTLTMICQHNSKSETIRTLNHHLAENVYVEREKFLRNMIEGNNEDPWDRNTLNRLNISFPLQEIVALVMRYDFDSRDCDKDTVELQINMEALYRRIRKSVGDEGITLLNQSREHEIVICLKAEGGDRQQISDVISRIRLECFKSEIPEPVIGIGSITSSSSGFSNSLKQAKVGLDYLFFMNDIKAIFYDDLIEKKGITKSEVCHFFTVSAQYSKKILNAVVSLDANMLTALSEELFDFIVHSVADRGTVCHYFTGLIGELSTLLIGSYGAIEDINMTGGYILDAINRFNRLEDMKKWFQVLLLNVNSGISKIKCNKEKQIVEKVMDIIKKEYHQCIGIETIANRLELSPNHLGCLFRQYTGKRFTEVLTDYRMKKAEALLVSGTVNVIDTANAVGFVNTAYFCTVFKKTHGISPSEYQKKFLRMNG